MSNGNWYVIRTTPRAEYLAASELVLDGFEVFFPTLKSQNSHWDTQSDS